jgi:hypothetical protein
MVQSRVRKNKAGIEGIKTSAGGKSHPASGPTVNAPGIENTTVESAAGSAAAESLVNGLYDDEALNLQENLSAALASESITEKTERIPPKTRKLAQKEAQQAAIVLLGLIDGLAIVLYGETARMLDYERELIADPLQRIIERSNLLNADAVNKYSDPLLLTMGLIGWFSRVNRERKEKSTPAELPQDPGPQDPGQPRTTPKNGKVAAEVLTVEQVKAPAIFKDQMQKGGIDVK